MDHYLVDPPNRRSGSQRCQATVVSTGKRCSQKTIKGKRYCKVHLRPKDDESIALSHYAEGSSEILRGKLLEIAALPEDERRTLNCEVELLIYMVSTSWSVYDQVCVQGKLDVGEKRNAKARGHARVCVQDAIDRLSKVQLANAKLESMRQGRVTVDNLRGMACQIMDILEEELEDKDVYTKICRKIESIKMSSEDSARVSMTID